VSSFWPGAWGWEFDGDRGGSVHRFGYGSRYGWGEHVALGSFMWGGGKVGWFCVLYSSLSILCRLVRMKCWGVYGVALGFSAFPPAVGGRGPCWEELDVGEV